MNIGIIGVGGVGGYFGGKIAKKFENDSEHKVFFLARGEHLNKIRENGITLIIDGDKSICCRPFLVTDNLEEFEVLDICIICVKSYDLSSVLKSLKNKITTKTEILPLLNGIDISDRIHKIIGNALVYPSCAYIGTHIKEPGVIEKSEGVTKIITGPRLGDKDEKQPVFLRIFKECGINCEWTKENRAAIWSKYMCVAPYSIVCAYYDHTIGEVYNDRRLKMKVLNIAKLIWKIAREEGVILPEVLPKESVEKVSGYPLELKTSFHRDFENKNKQNEKETFVDSLLELAKKHDLDSACVLEIINK